MKKNISIIVTVYNNEKEIGRCIESIINQTYREFELIVINDGSQDKSGEICEQYAEEDERIIVMHQKNGGVSKARNVGIDFVLENNRSEWIMFVDGDDWLHIDCLSKMYEAVSKDNTKIAVCEYITSNSSKCEFPDMGDVEVITPEKLLRRSQSLVTVIWGKLYHKSLFENIRFPVGKIREDAFITWKLIFQVKTLSMINSSLWVYFLKENSIMRSKWTTDHLDVIDAFEEKIDFFKSKGYEKAYIHTISSYVNCMAQLVENLNRYYPNDERKKNIQQRMKEIYRAYGKQLGFSFKKRIYIYAMMLPLNMNFIPYILRLKRNFVEVWTKEGIKGIWQKIKEKLFVK